MLPYKHSTPHDICGQRISAWRCLQQTCSYLSKGCKTVEQFHCNLGYSVFCCLLKTHPSIILLQMIILWQYCVRVTKYEMSFWFLAFCPNWWREANRGCGLESLLRSSCVEFTAPPPSAWVCARLHVKWELRDCAIEWRCLFARECGPAVEWTLAPGCSCEAPLVHTSAAKVSTLEGKEIHEFSPSCFTSSLASCSLTLQSNARGYDACVGFQSF